MNKAFVKEPDSTVEFCPRCGAAGEPVQAVTLAAHLKAEDMSRLSSSANFCPTPTCEVAYFDMFERVVLAAELPAPVYPKDLDAPICACFGLTLDDLDQDIAEGGVARVKAALTRAQSPEAQCATHAANGRNCVAYVQKQFLKRKAEGGRRN